MNFKITLLNICAVISLTVSLPAPGRNGLLRTPKVYNAVITTDDNLAPSRAFPLIQPYIHEQPIAFSSFNGITSFGHPFSGFYDYSNFHGNLGYSGGAPNGGKQNENIQSRNKEEPSIQTQNSDEPNSITTPKPYDNIPETTLLNKPGSPQSGLIENSSESQQQEQQQQLPQQQQQQPQPQQQLQQQPKPPQEEPHQQNADNKSPIPLNEFGLPPSLVPFSSYGQQYPSHINNPYNLQPYQYQSYPLIYDSFNGYQGNPLLPPFTFYPPSSGGPQGPSDAFEDNFQKGRSLSQLPSAEQSILGLEARDDITAQTSKSNVSKQNIPPPQPFPTHDVINYANKNKNIPDVPPPPLPTSRKSQ